MTLRPNQWPLLLVAMAITNCRQATDSQSPAAAASETKTSEKKQPPDQPKPRIKLDSTEVGAGGTLAGRVLDLPPAPDSTSAGNRNAKETRIQCADADGRVWASAPLAADGRFSLTLPRAHGRVLQVRCMRGRDVLCEAPVYYRSGARPGAGFAFMAWLPHRPLTYEQWERLRRRGVTAVVATHREHHGARALPYVAASALAARRGKLNPNLIRQAAWPKKPDGPFGFLVNPGVMRDTGALLDEVNHELKDAGVRQILWYGAGPLLPSAGPGADLSGLLLRCEGWIGVGGDLQRAFVRSFGRGGMAQISLARVEGANDWRVGILEGDTGLVFAPAELHEQATTAPTPTQKSDKTANKKGSAGQASDSRGETQFVTIIESPSGRDWPPPLALARLPVAADVWRWSGVARLVGLCDRSGDEVGVLYSANTVRASWALDVKRAGAQWAARHRQAGSAVVNLRAWAALLSDLGVGFRFVNEAEIARPASGLAPGRPRVLILPRTLVVSEALAARIDAYVRRGGTLIACSAPGLFDANGEAQVRGGAMDATFGITRRRPLPVRAGGRRLSEIEGKVIPAINGTARFLPKPRKSASTSAPAATTPRALYEAASIPRVFLAGLAVGELGLSLDGAACAASVGAEPCLLIHQRGSGRAALFNLTFSSYLNLRRQPTVRTAADGAVEGGLAASQAEDRGEPLRRLVRYFLALAGARGAALFWRADHATGTLRVIRYTRGPLELFGVYDAVPRHGLSGVDTVRLRFQTAADFADGAESNAGWPIFDCLRGRIVGDGRHAQLPLDEKGMLGPTLLARLPYQLREIDIELVGSGRQGRFTLSLRAAPAPTPWAPHVLAIELVDPAGKIDPANRTHVTVIDGEGQFALPLPAIGALPGLWSVRVRDVATGRRALRRFHVQ